MAVVAVPTWVFVGSVVDNLETETEVSTYVNTSVLTKHSTVFWQKIVRKSN